MADDSTLGLGLNNPQYQDLITKQQEAIKAANQPYGMDAGQGAIAAGLGLLPALIGGLIRGKEGLNIGAQAGLAGVGSYDNILKNNYERQSENEKANAVLYGQQAQALATQDLGLQRALQMEGIKQGNRIALKQQFPSKGTNVTVNLSPESVGVDKDTRKLIQPQLDIYQSMSQSINAGKNVLSENPELNDLNYNDVEGSVKTLGEGVKAWAVGNESPLGRLRAETMAAATDYAKAISGAAVSDKEFDRLYSIVAGTGKIPATPKVMLETLNHIRNKVGERAVMAAVAGGSLTGRYKTPEEALSSPSVEGVRQLLKLTQMGYYGDIAPSKTSNTVQVGANGKPFKLKE